MANKKKAAPAPKTMTVQGAWVYKGKDESGGEKGAESNAPTVPASISVKTVSSLPHSGWLPVTSLKSGYTVFVPLPIRLIHQIPDNKGGGCIVRGAHGDEATARESVLEVLGMLNGYPLKTVSTWSLAG